MHSRCRQNDLSSRDTNNPFMRLAKSLLLGELLNADSVDYEDVNQNRFWIVCPVWKEIQR